MPSQVDLCNKALRRLGEDPIIALDENSVWGRRCLAALPEVIRSVLSLDYWRSATKRAVLAADAQTPIGYTSSYSLPSNCLHVVALKLSQYEKWSIEGNKILTNNPKNAPLEIMYVREVVDPNQFTPTLYEAVALGLAHELSGYSTATNVSRDDIYGLYAQALSIAQNVNARENPVLSLAPGSWIDARFTQMDFSPYSLGGY